MLVLSRKKNEEIILGDGPNQVVIVVKEIHGARTRIGVHAPKHMKIIRGELIPPAISLAPGTTHDVSDDLPRPLPQAKDA